MSMLNRHLLKFFCLQMHWSSCMSLTARWSVHMKAKNMPITIDIV